MVKKYHKLLNLRKIHISLLIGVVLTLMLSSCSTKKNKWNRRVYHNITSHYNAYFNGHEALKKGINTIVENNKDDYTDILSVFQLGTKEEVTSAIPDLDRTVLKASIVIHKHSMFFRKKEHIKWVYYSYLLMGEAKFYKHEYGTAKQIFRYIVTKYPKERVKQDAQLWIALIESTQGEYEDAIAQLDAIKSKVSSGQVSKESYRMLPKVYADVYIKEKNYSAAVPYLKEAITRANKKSEKVRLLFILGQVEQREKNYKTAISSYLQVLKKNPSYEMDFNARMNMAKCYTGGNSKVVIKQLQKMLKDIKNKEFKDQIYYVLAEIALKDKNKELAIKYLKLSVASSINNKKQKAFSALKLAQLYFADEKYKNAQAYYDSTMLFLPKSYPDYDKLNQRKKVLTDLVNNLIIIQTEDSLQTLARMSTARRNKTIDGYIKAEIALEKLKAQQEKERQEKLQFLMENRQEEKQLKSVTKKGNVSWYFYNPNSVTAGRSEFQAIWGKRKLADNWRLSDKETITFDDESDTPGDSSTTNQMEANKGNKNNNRKSRDYYLQNVPLSPALMDSSNARIETALYNVALIYKEKLLNNPKSIASFNELTRRFPHGRYNAEAYYNLYRIYMLEGNKGDARFYKKKLLKEYPDSEYAKLLSDPNYFKKLQQQANQINRLYKSTYNLYINKHYKEVQAKCIQAKHDYPSNKKFLSKFEMLNALCVGTSRDTAAFIAALQKVVNDYPKSEVKPKAEEMISLLQSNKKAKAEAGNAKNSSLNKTKKEEEKSIFVYNPDKTHMFLILADRRKIAINELKNRLSNHDSKYFGTDNLTISAIPINANVLLIGVSNFKNKIKAIDYLKTVRRNSTLYALVRQNGGNYFVISEGNYARLYRSKDIKAYKTFYHKYYPKGK